MIVDVGLVTDERCEEKDERVALRKIVTKSCSRKNQRNVNKKPVNTGFKVEGGRDSNGKLAGLMSHEVNRMAEERGTRR